MKGCVNVSMILSSYKHENFQDLCKYQKVEAFSRSVNCNETIQVCIYIPIYFFHDLIRINQTLFSVILKRKS